MVRAWIHQRRPCLTLLLVCRYADKDSEAAITQLRFVQQHAPDFDPRVPVMLGMCRRIVTETLLEWLTFFLFTIRQAIH